jgi:hypothetical protein
VVVAGLEGVATALRVLRVRLAEEGPIRPSSARNSMAREWVLPFSSLNALVLRKTHSSWRLSLERRLRLGEPGRPRVGRGSAAEVRAGRVRPMLGSSGT